MLRKLISGVCVLGLVCTLMVGCTEEEVKEDNNDTKQEQQQEEVKEEASESNLDKAYDLVMDLAKDNFVENDESAIKILKDEGKLIIQLTLKNVEPEEMLQITNAEWNKTIENDAKETVQALLDGLKEAGYPEEKLMVLNDVRESFTIINNLNKKKDVYALYENDLPDTYNE